MLNNLKKNSSLQIPGYGLGACCESRGSYILPCFPGMDLILPIIIILLKCYYIVPSWLKDGGEKCFLGRDLTRLVSLGSSCFGKLGEKYYIGLLYIGLVHDMSSFASVFSYISLRISVLSVVSWNGKWERAFKNPTCGSLTTKETVGLALAFPSLKSS